jgi:protoheme IX farnesyltransferase
LHDGFLVGGRGPRRLVQSVAAYEEFAGICQHSFTLFATRLYVIQKPQDTLPLRIDMKTTTIPLTRLQLPSRSGLATRVPHFVTLMKPRVMVLAVFTAFVGLMIAPSRLDPLLGFIAILAIATGAGAAGVLNMWYDADIDAVMTRTAGRPIPRGAVTRLEALAFGLVLAGISVSVLALALNLTAAALLAFAIFFYVVVYTVWLKRSTPQNIVIGGAAGALPPVIGWAAATGEIGLEPLILFLIVFLWTPPHFWALSLNRADEYARAGVPMLPVVAGRAETTRQILIYSILLFPISLLPWALGFAGAIYGATAVLCGAAFIALALRLVGSNEADRRPAHRLFAFSILYLFLLFAALCAGNGGGRWSLMVSARPAAAAVAPVDPALCVTRGSNQPEGA